MNLFRKWKKINSHRFQFRLSWQSTVVWLVDLLILITVHNIIATPAYIPILQWKLLVTQCFITNISLFMTPRSSRGRGVATPRLRCSDTVPGKHLDRLCALTWLFSGAPTKEEIINIGNKDWKKKKFKLCTVSDTDKSVVLLTVLVLSMFKCNNTWRLAWLGKHVS